MSLRRVRKRDGREVRFDRAKIAGAVRAAQEAVGEQDPSAADEVAGLVELTLRRRYAAAERAGRDVFAGPGAGEEGAGGELTRPEAVPDIEEIQDLVERALIELGRAAVAKAYILYRDRRSRARTGLEVRSAAPAGRGDAARVQVRQSEGSFPWSKGRIVAALVEEAELPRHLSEEVAARVERSVLASGLRHISTGLIRELVDNELIAMGLASALARHEPVSLPRHDLRALLARGPRAEAAEAGRAPRLGAGRRVAEGSVEGAVAGEILRRWTLSDLVDERHAELHFAGDLHLEDATRPHLYLVQSVPCDLLRRGGDPARAAWDLLEEAAELAAAVSRGVVLEGPLGLLGPLARSQRGEGPGALQSWLVGLGALARATGKRFDLARPGTRSPAALARLVHELAELDLERPGEVGPRLFLAGEELQAATSEGRGVRAELARLVAAGRVVPTWSRADERTTGPGCRRRGREPGALACGGAVALNLVRAARRAGPWREDLLLERLAELVEASVDALERLSAFQREHRATRSGEARGRVAFALVPVGLREALRLVGDGELRADQGARVLGLLSDAARRYAAERGLSVVLTPFFGERAARRFARLDASRPRASQRLLFGEPVGEARNETPYTTGFDLGRLPDAASTEARALAEARLLATVPTGCWLPPADPEAAREDELLAIFERFDAARRPSEAADPTEPADSGLFPTPSRS